MRGRPALTLRLFRADVESHFPASAECAQTPAADAFRARLSTSIDPFGKMARYYCARLLQAEPMMGRSIEEARSGSIEIVHVFA